MKIKKINLKKYLLIKLYLIKYQIYTKKYKNLTNVNIEQLEFNLKQSLNIIYNYHVNKKKICFIGFPYFKSHMINYKNLKHDFIPKNTWINGLISNKKMILDPTIFIEKKKFKNYINFIEKPKLVVFFNPTKKELNIIKELNNIDTPIIIFGNLITQKNMFYNVSGNFDKTLSKKFCQFLIYSILKNN